MTGGHHTIHCQLPQTRRKNKPSAIPEIIEEHPTAIQMRFLQTVTDVGSERSNFVVLRVPIDLFSSFMSKGAQHNGQPEKDGRIPQRAR